MQNNTWQKNIVHNELIILSEMSRYVKFTCDYDFFVFAAGYIDVDCGIRRDAVPSVDGLLATSPCCSMDCTGDDCPPTQDRCAELGLLTTDAISKATCRFDVNTVRPTSLLTEREITELIQK